MSQEPKAKLLPQIVAALTGCIGGFCLGTVIGWASPAESPVDREYGIKGTQWSWISSINTLGSAISVLPLPILMEKIGRKYSMMLSGIFLSITWIVLGFLETFWPMVTARFLCGFFSGSFCVVSPVYTGEVVEPRIRGALGSCFQLFIVFGILLMFCLGSCDNIQVLSFVPAVAPIIMIVILFFLPDSPLYLIDSGKTEDKIDASYRFLRGKDYDFTKEKVDLAKELIESDAKKSEGVLFKFKQKATKKAFIICFLINIAQQLSGINIIMYYAAGIFKDSGSSLSPTISSIILGVGQVFGTLLAVGLSDRAGRRIMLILSFGLMSICLLLMGIYMAYKVNDIKNVENIGMLPVVITTIYVVVFSIGAGPLVWALIGEMFAPEVKSVVSSICAFANWFFAFLITVTFKYMTDAINSYGAYWFYSACGALCTLFVIFFVMETKHKTLKEIQIALGGGEEREQ